MQQQRDLLAAIKEGKPILIDSAMGTSLMNHGMKAGILSEEYNFNHPDIIFDIHVRNIEAGVDIITTNTFGANDYKLAEKGLKTQSTIEKAVAIAHNAANGKAWVAQDIGPIGKMLKPYGDLTRETAVSLFAEQVLAGREAGVDMFLIETMFDMAELEIAAEEAMRLGGGKPVFCSISIQKKDKTLMGNSIEQVSRRMFELGVHAFGINCGFGPIQMLDLVPVLIGANDTKIRSFMQPNAGLPKIDENNNIMYDMQKEEYGKYMVEIYNSGVTILGGCCGTTPEYLKVIRERMDKDITNNVP